MIPHDFITEWRLTAPWIMDVQVEQDLLITRALVEIFSNEQLAGELAFRGGTALYKLHITPPARYSEDIDLVQVRPGPIGSTLSTIRSLFDPWLGTPKRKASEGRVTLIYRVSSEGPPPLPIRLKIEINSREHFAAFGIEHRSLQVSSRWFTGSASVPTYALDELLGTKLRALFQRKKGRDLFDLWFANRVAEVNPDRVVACFTQYLAHQELKVSRAELEANLHAKCKDSSFTEDVAPLIAPGAAWDADDAARYVLTELTPRVPGNPWKGL